MLEPSANGGRVVAVKIYCAATEDLSHLFLFSNYLQPRGEDYQSYIVSLALW